MAKKKQKKKSPNRKTPMPVKVILGVASPRNSVLLPTSPQTPLTLESESPPPPKKILKLKKPSCSEDEDDEACSENEDDEASVKSSSVHPSSSSEEFSGEDEDEEDSADEESSSSESESIVHHHKDANSVVKHAVKPSEQPAVNPSEQPTATLDEQPAKQATKQSAEAPIEQPAAQGEAANVIGGQFSVAKGIRENAALPTEDVSAEGKWETVKKKHKSNWQPKKNMAENVRGLAAKAASGVAARAASGMVDAVADTMPGSGVAASAANVVTDGAASSVAAKAVSEKEGLKANMGLVHNASPKAANGVAGKVDSVVGMGDGSRPVIGVAGAPTGAMKGVAGAPTGAVKGAAGVKLDKAIRGMTDKAAEIDPLVAAWAVSGVTVGADSSIANGADIVDSAVHLKPFDNFHRHHEHHRPRS
ncbi:hypothetical protein OIU85_004539 [Salix viminalis]|uniref:Uncharacterized protein n=1 Tax=Salix viminalis TaxID=40686 RepID=A0A9Q0SXK1_SALVM|nr:hypothetical protein OIU85_004539 [Salix viminalis]